MSDLIITRLSATIHGPEEHLGRADTLLRRVAARRLEASLAHEALPEGEWCVRRVDLTISLDDEADGVLEGAWADAIVASLRQALSTGTGEIVRFADVHHAVIDLARGVAVGDLRRAWAWRLAGALRAGDPDPENDPRGALLAACAHTPHAAVAALVRAVQATDPRAVQRLVGVEGLTRLTAVVSTAYDAGGLLARVVDAMAEDKAREDSYRSGMYPGPPAASGPAYRDRARRLIGGSVLARAVVSGGERIAADLAARWAVLASAEADPSALRGADAVRLIAAVGQLLESHETDRGAWHETEQRAGLGRPLAPTYTKGPGRSAGAAPSRRGEQAASQNGAGAPERPTPSEPQVVAAGATERPTPSEPPIVAADAPAAELDREADTDWGGLLFLLNAAADAGLPGRFEDARLAARPLPWTLHQLARRLVPAAADDPAVLAFAGLGYRPPLRADDPATAEELGGIEDLAQEWATAAAHRLAIARHGAVRENPFSEVAAMALRPAVIVADPGWLEVRFSLDDIDIYVRKAGLDIDPGWVAWLGTVVRFRYD